MLAGGYVGWYERERNAWYGDAPEHIHTIYLAEQCVDYVEDWDHMLILAEGGRRSGKTTGALAPKIVICMLVFASLPGEVLSPTYRQTKNVRRAVLRHVPQSWWATWPVPATPPITLEMIHGSTASLLTAANQDSARSEGVAWGAYDERQDIPEEAFGNALLSTSEAEEQPYIFETATIKPELREHHDAVIASDMSEMYPMTTSGNCFINSERLIALAKEFLDVETVERELEAKWPELFGRIFGGWDKDQHVVSYPAHGLRDATASILGDKFHMPPFGEGAARWLCSIDPPVTAALWKLYEDETAHLVHEVLVGADGAGGGVETLAQRVHGVIGSDSCVVIQDPHEHKWDVDVIKHFKKLGHRQYRFVSLRHLPVMYKHAAARARAQRGKLLVDPRCAHAVEVLERHQYDRNGRGDADKKQTYIKAHQRESKKVQLVHLSDTICYPLYRLWPVKLDYKQLEDKAAA